MIDCITRPTSKFFNAADKTIQFRKCCTHVRFFFFPVDKEDNNTRIYVIRTALEEMRLVS